MAELTTKRYECPECGYIILKSKAAGEEGYCPLPHDRPYQLAYKGEVLLTTT
jgi:hypothetical protein